MFKCWVSILLVTDTEKLGTLHLLIGIQIWATTVHSDIQVLEPLKWVNEIHLLELLGQICDIQVLVSLQLLGSDWYSSTMTVQLNKK